MNSFQKYSALSCLLLGFASNTVAEPLTFERALNLAQQQSPLLQAGDASIRAAQLEATASGRLPDPKLSVGVDNYPVSGPMRGSLEGDFMTMQKLGFMQEVPNSAKRDAQRQAAAAAVGTSEASLQIAHWKVRVAAAQAWLTRSNLERKLDVFQALEADNATLAGALHAQVASGRGEAVESVELQQEQSRLEDRRDELQRDIARAKANLRQLIGPLGDEPIAGAAPRMEIDPEMLHAHLAAHPQLQGFSAAKAVADAEVNAAKAQKHPDWSVELGYAKRGPQFGNMISVQFTIGLPLFGATRQDPMVASKAMQRSRIEAESEAMRRERISELDADLAEREALQAQLHRLQERSLPLAEQRVELLTAAYAAAKANLSSVFSARRELLEERLRAIDLQSQLDSVTAKLYFTFEASAQ